MPFVLRRPRKMKKKNFEIFPSVFFSVFVFFTVAGAPPLPYPSPLHPQHLLQPLQLQLPVGDRVFDRQSGNGSRVVFAAALFLLPSPLSPSALSSLFLRTLKFGPDRRGELRARRAATSSTDRSPRGHSEEGAVQVERLGAQHKVLEVEGRGAGSRRARRHRREMVEFLNVIHPSSLFPFQDPM